MQRVENPQIYEGSLAFLLQNWKTMGERQMIKLIKQGTSFYTLNFPRNLKLYAKSNIFQEGNELSVRTENFPYPSSEAASLSCLNLQSGLVQALPYLQARPDDGATVGFSSGFGGSSN